MLKNEVQLSITCLRTSRCLKFDAGDSETLKRRIGDSEVTSDIHLEPTKSTIHSILLEDVEHTCSYPQPPSAGSHSGQGSSYGVDRQGGAG